MKKEDLEVIDKVHYISTCSILDGKQSKCPDYTVYYETIQTS